MPRAIQFLKWFTKDLKSVLRLQTLFLILLLLLPFGTCRLTHAKSKF